MSDEVQKQETKAVSSKLSVLIPVAALVAATIFVMKDVDLTKLMGNKVPPVVVIDSAKIIEGTVGQALNQSKKNPDYDSAKEVERISASLTLVMERFANQGTIVLQKDNGIVALPYWLDVTESVAKEIGVDVNQKIVY
jgi:hypothetical protein